MATLNCPEEVELAELLRELHSWAHMCRFARTGGEAMAIAVRIARAKTRRSLVAFCGYHGWSDWYLAANRTRRDSLGGDGLLLPGLDPAGVPVELTGTALAFSHNDINGLHEIVVEHPGKLAAIVAEPQRYEKPKPGFLSGLREVAAREGAVLIFDEITSGLRLNTGGVHLLYGEQPDIAVFAKGLGNGFPISAVIGTCEAMEAAEDTFISSTYWTERVGPAAAIATLKKHRQVKAHERMIDAGRRVQATWRDAAERTGLRAQVGHPDMPPLSHLSFDYPNTRAVRTLYCQMMLDEGYLDNAGFYATYAHTEEILAEHAAAVHRVFPEVAKAVSAGTVERQLRGPVGHSSFARLTKS
jgi:glutamate-1-semialdehyde aminotransferase